MTYYMKRKRYKVQVTRSRAQGTTQYHHHDRHHHHHHHRHRPASTTTAIMHHYALPWSSNRVQEAAALGCVRFMATRSSSSLSFAGLGPQNFSFAGPMAVLSAGTEAHHPKFSASTSDFTLN